MSPLRYRCATVPEDYSIVRDFCAVAALPSLSKNNTQLFFSAECHSAALPSLSKNNTQLFFSAECHSPRRLFNCQGLLRGSGATFPLKKQHSVVFSAECHSPEIDILFSTNTEKIIISQRFNPLSFITALLRFCLQCTGYASKLPENITKIKHLFLELIWQFC